MNKVHMQSITKVYLFYFKKLLICLLTNKTIEQSTLRESPQPRKTKVPPILLNVSIDVGILTLKNSYK